MIHYEYKPEYNIDPYNPRTLGKVLLERAEHLGTPLKEEFVELIATIGRSCKLINYHLRQAGIQNLYGDHEGATTNASGETQKKIDVISNDILKTQLISLNSVAAIASEEEDNIIPGKAAGKFLVTFDPLDGSSNIDCNVTVGTIFGIWLRDPSRSGPVSKEDFFQIGRKQLAAGYCIYGNATQLILAFNNQVDGYTQGDNLGDFILTHPKITCKPTFNNYSVNEGNEKKWYKWTKEWIKDKKYPTAGSSYSLRYIGSMVGDVHRTLLYGGVFMYPADTSSPKGKLRVLYECLPLGFVVEAAGGKATDGENNILDLLPTDIHQRTSIILGSIKDVQEIEEYVKKHGK